MGDSITVLIFEGDPAQLFGDMLAASRKPEFSVQQVRTLADGLTLLRSQDFDVILVDLDLADSQGLETALAVRNQATHTPLIVLTGSDSEEAALQALQSDIQDYLIKGEITGAVLKRSIRYALQRHRDMQAQWHYEQQFSSFMDNLPVAAWIKDLNGRYVFWNPGNDPLLSTSFPDYSGKTDEEVYPPETARRLRENDAQALATGKCLQAVETLRLVDGIEHHFMVNKFPIPGTDGSAEGVGGIAMDITDRLTAMEALRLSEARFRALHDENPAMIFTIDAEGNIISTNSACTAQLGYRDDELTGQPVLNIFHEDDRSLLAEQLAKCRQNPDQVYRWQARKIRKDRELLWVEEMARVVYDLNGALNVLVVCQDVTERKRAEEALLKSERKFATVFQKAPALLSVSSLRDGTFIDVNETMLATLGFQRDEIIGHTGLELGVWTDPSERAAIVETLQEKGSVRNIEVKFRGKGGQTFIGLFSAEYVDIGGERYMLSLVKDITLKRQAQEKAEQLNVQLAARAVEMEQANRELADDLEAMRVLQKLGMLFLHEKSLEQILSQVLDAAIAISDADFGNIQMIDPKTSSLQIAVQHGFPQWWLDFWNRVTEGHGVCGTALKRGERVIVEDIEGSSIFAGTDALEIQRKAGVRAVQSTPLVSRSGGFLGMFSTHYKNPHRPSDRELRLLDLLARHAADFIEQAKLMEMLEARAAELEEANRDLMAFNYTVAHDLRNPLNLIYGYCQMIGRACGEKLDEECRGYLQKNYHTVQRMNQLIVTLLEFSHMARAELHRERFDISAMAQVVAEELKQSEPERNVEFRISYGIMVDGDRDLLRVVLHNLIGNAWKFTATCTETIIEFGVTQRDGKAACFVRDNGPGFDMADAGKLFVPFQRLAATVESKGFGIGLATVERIIRRHGGRIWAEGEPGKGATFFFTLPAS